MTRRLYKSYKITASFEMMLWLCSFCVTVEFLFTRTPYTFISNTKTLIVFGTPGTVLELSCLKACQISKVHARSHEVTNIPCATEFELQKHWQKAMTILTRKQTMMLTRTTQMLNKSRIVANRTSKMRENNMQLDKEDTQRSDLNCKFLSVTLVLKYPDSYICCRCGQ